MVRTNTYKIICDTGETVLVIAKTRSQAIARYCQEKSMTRQWFSDHCKIVFEGR